MSKPIEESELLQLIKRLDLNSEITPKANVNFQPEGSNSQDGWVKVEHNKIIVHDPFKGGSVPTIKWLEPVRIKKNDKLMLLGDSIKSTDKISWDINQCKQLFEIMVSTIKWKFTFRFLLKIYMPGI
jgi:hypothetical protein